MITAVDINVLLDILIPGAPHGDASEQAINEALEAGTVIIAEAVYAELAAHFAQPSELDRFLTDTGIRLERASTEALARAGRAWHLYRQ